MRTLKFAVAMIACACFGACSAPEAPLNFQRLALSVGPCNGVCPEFSLSVDENGSVLFEPKRHTAVASAQRAELAPAQFQALKDALIQATATPLLDHYDASNCPDFARDRAELTWQMELRGKQQSIRQNLGCMSALIAGERQTFYPPQLDSLYRRMIELTGATQWLIAK
jgi:Domain of unknown function (DUF6438)